MRYEWMDTYLLSLPGAEKDYKAEWGWFRYQIRDKLFAELLRLAHPEILPGFYMDKRKWIACLLDGELPEDVLRQLCTESHRLVLEKLPKYVQREILDRYE